jgi:outer membrane protein assembly factor BamB
MRTAAFLACVIVLLGVGCARWKTDARPDSKMFVTAEQKEIRREALRQEIRNSTLFKELVWDIPLSAPFVVDGKPVLAQEEISRITLLEDSMYIETTDWKLYCVDKSSGMATWVLELEKPLDFPPARVSGASSEKASYLTKHSEYIRQLRTEQDKKEVDAEAVRKAKDSARDAEQKYRQADDRDLVYFISRTVLYCVDSGGNLRWRKALSFSPIAAPCPTVNYVFIPACDRGRVVIFDLDTRSEKAECRATKSVLTQPVFKDPSLYFTSEDGGIYAFNANGVRNWCYPTERAIYGETTIQGDCIYVGSSDGALYCVDRTSSKLHAKREVGAPITTKPVVAGDSVYFKVDGKGLFCTNAVRTTGPQPVFSMNVKWVIPDGERFLVRSGGRSYVLTGSGEILGVVDATGRVACRYRLPSFKHFLSNPETNTLYLATSDGYIFAVSESDTEY